MQLKTILKQKGYKVKDLYDRVSLKRLVSYQMIAKYCRCINKNGWEPRLQAAIESCLAEMGVEWS